MTNMYYEKNPEVAHEIRDIAVNLLGHRFHFLTDSGVFSKRMVDYGSQVLLDTLELEKEKKLLDVGCGYGPIGLALAKVFEVEATLIDINERALDLAEKNAIANQITAKIVASNLYENISEKYDYIVSNPPIRAGKKVVHEVISGAVDHLMDGGSLTIVIQKKQGAPSAKKKMEEIFGNCAIKRKDKGYYILESKKQ